ncbi:TRAP transporter 4TM/12TM fusion protein [Evansella vedderi]|uniref:TRAP transporter 4TM/12TM fusion protein n=1 Tax=Evansella vedderi TaxID=38282 RepID=A0ABT9ZQ54_9BACI|nr:TRAP transporter permease [Evansella vedderi]MDQ0252852.1 TRAP transporter 4TM/12TM fusion protein [Evansella vedderi]
MEDKQKKALLELEGSDRHLRKGWAGIVLVVSVLMASFHLYIAGFGFLPGMGSREFLVLHLTLGLVLVFLIFPIKRGLGQVTIPWYDCLIALYAVYIGFHIMTNQTATHILNRNPTDFDLFISFSLIVLVLEATRRVVGKPLVIIAGIFILYFFLGEYMPGQFYHSRGDLTRFLHEMGYTRTGIFGTPIYASALYVFIFILFGAVLESTGAGKMFIDLALRGFGRYKGGPAKASVVASGMLGSISGSSTANAVTTGTFTIPLMKRVGFKPHVAGGVEVAASSSGQFLPPIMGAAAFIMVEMTGIPYVDIIKSALIPAILCYVAILFMVHFEASKNNIRGMDKSELVSGKKLLVQQGYLIVPVLVLIYFLVFQGRSVFFAAFFAIMLLLVLAFFAHKFKERIGRSLIYAGVLFAIAFGMEFILGSMDQNFIRWHSEIAMMVVLGTVLALVFALMQKKYNIEAAPVRFGIKQLLEGFELAARNSLSVIVACATAGILIGVLQLSGLSTKFVRIVTGFSADLTALMPSFLVTDNTQLYFALILSLFACLLLGLGLPTTATYIILAAIVAPVLVQLGLPVLAAHLFVLYYGVLADDTPPINLPAYATAGIAKAGPVRTGIQGFKYDSGALLLPFAFAMNPTILLLTDDPWFMVVKSIITALLGIIAFSSFIQNWLLRDYTKVERIGALITALMLVHFHWITDIIGITIFAVIITTQYLSSKQNKQQSQIAL